MKRTLIFVILSSILLTAGLASGSGTLQLKAEKVISKVIIHELKGTPQLNQRLYTIPAVLKSKLEQQVDQKFYRDTVCFWEVTGSDGSRAFAMMDDVLGKQLPITFLVVFNGDGEILSSRVIKYRERYGSGVRSKRWLSQFYKKKSGSGFRMGKDIDAISGATISSNSVSRGIEKLAHLMKYILKNH